MVSMRRFLLVLIVVGLGTGSAWYFVGRDRSTAWRGMLTGSTPNGFRTLAVERGDLLVTISATGTVEPEEVVDVGAQVAGMIKTFGRDPANSNKAIDYGSAVQEGTVLAQIDDGM